MKKVLVLMALAIVFFLSQGCDPENVLDEVNNTSGGSELSSDYIWSDDHLVNIALNGTSATADSSIVSINGSIVTIKSAGYYSVSGSLANGQLIVDADSGIVRIKLNGVVLTNSSTSPFYVKNSTKTIVFLNEGTTNSITDASSYSNTDEPNAAIFSNGYMAFAGSGSLTVKGNYNDGISCDDELIINGGIINVSAKDDAIRGKNFLKITDGTITATGSGGHALKSDNEDKAGYGYVKVDGGILNLTSSSADGIHGVKRVIINGGTISISASGSQGLHADSLVLINGGSTTIKVSKEGVESPLISMKGGSLSITASDDGLNATYGNGGESSDNSLLTISGGSVYINASGGDGLDSNGNITMSGGTVVVNGPKSQPEVGLDYNGTFKISGGLLIISGVNSNMTQGASTSSSQYSLKLSTSSTVSAGTLFNIQDASGNSVVTFKAERAFTSIIYSSASLVRGSSYSIYTGGISTGTLSNGLYTGGVYSGGALKKTFTISSIVTSTTF